MMKNDNEFLKGSKVEVRNNDIYGALRKLKKKVTNEKILKEYREKCEYMSKGEKRRREKAAARRRHLKEKRNNDDNFNF